MILTPSAQELRAFDFAVTVSVAGSPNITRTVQGAFTVRNELIEVVAVEASPAFTDPGGQANVSARLLNAVNQTRQARVSYTVTNPAGTVVFTSVPQDVELTVLSSLSTIDLGVLNTTGFTLGDHITTSSRACFSRETTPSPRWQASISIPSPGRSYRSLVISWPSTSATSRTLALPMSSHLWRELRGDRDRLWAP